MRRQFNAARKCLADRWALALAVSSLPLSGLATPTQLHPLFPPGCTVVLVVGLPGDLESETSFRDQLHNWLNILRSSGSAQQAIVLCDNPEAVMAPATPQTKVLKGNRENFLGLGRMLGAATNPLVVIAWGHAGRQGATPVLHVRGPRLAPTDFATLAAQVPARDSRWILLFRGSGAFAAQLAGPGRQILSSDGGELFNSDPVAMAILLKALRGRPSMPFDELTAQFARTTAAWYAERHLARTEQPTLWLENEKPRTLIAEAPAGNGGSPARPDLDGETATELKAGATNPAPETVASSAAATNELGPVWKDIKKVRPQDYPEADGVILRQRSSFTLGSSPALSSEQEKFVQILTPEGKQFGDFDVSFSPPYEELEFLDCEVLGPDGTLRRLDPENITEARPQTLGDYQVGRRKFFSLPGVVPGAVLHVRYRSEWKEFPLPHFSMDVPVGQELPALDSVVEISVPKGTAFHFGFEQVAAPDPEVKQSSYGNYYTWRFKELRAYEREVLTAPHRQPRLMFSTFEDWPGFAEWYARISQLSDEVTPEIAAKAKELTRTCRTDQEKVLALYNFVTALRYVAVPLGVNSFRPHAAANVLQNQFGDCKDKANLFNALLHAENIEAHLVLVPRFSQAYDGLPGLAFNHAISQVRLGGQTLWVDTTDDVCRFGLLPPGDPGRRVLVIDGQSSALTQLPTPAPQEHQLTISGHLHWSNAAEVPTESLAVAARGYPDYELREAARESKEQLGSLPLLASRFRPVMGAFALETQKATPVSAMDENFAWHGEGRRVGLAWVRGSSWRLPPPFWLPKEWDQALHRRQAPLYLNSGYPLSLAEDFELALPGPVEDASLPANCSNDQGPLRWRVEWARVSNVTLAARFHAELAHGELSPGETLLFQQQLRALLQALASDATLSLTP